MNRKWQGNFLAIFYFYIKSSILKMATGYVTGRCYTMSNGINKYEGNANLVGMFCTVPTISNKLVNTVSNPDYYQYSMDYDADNYTYIGTTNNYPGSGKNFLNCDLWTGINATYFPSIYWLFDKNLSKYKSQSVLCAVKCDFTNESFAEMFMGMVEFEIYKSEYPDDETYKTFENEINDFPVSSSLTKSIKEDSTGNVFSDGNSDLGINLRFEYSKNMLYGQNINGSISFTPSVTFNNSVDYQTALDDFQNNTGEGDIWETHPSSLVFYASSTSSSPVGEDSIIVTCNQDTATITITFNNCPSNAISDMFTQSLKFTAVASSKYGKDYGPKFNWIFTF